MDSGFRRNDRKWPKITSYQIYIIVRLWRRVQINLLGSLLFKARFGRDHGCGTPQEQDYKQVSE